MGMRDINWADLDREMTDEEKSWLRQRDLEAVIDANERKFGAMDPDEDEADEDDEESPPPATQKYESLTSDELKAEVKKRQAAGRELSIKGLTKKAEVAAVLREDDKQMALEAATE